ncbi:MAG: hypothetical protein NT120_05375 [Candidatus Aenigmarchaeota archaeon]|nr:hypothetical protein [Candidatus Aenigmarchaeota archaeon]
MKQAMYGWSLVLLVGFWISEYALKQGYTEQVLWVAWAIILNIINYAVLKSMKKTPVDIMSLWMTAGIFGLLVSFGVAGGLLALPFHWLMTLWFALLGATMFASGFKLNNPSSVMTGIVFVFGALLVPSVGYFAYGAIVFGLFSLVSTYFSK